MKSQVEIMAAIGAQKRVTVSRGWPSQLFVRCFTSCLISNSLMQPPLTLVWRNPWTELCSKLLLAQVERFGSTWTCERDYEGRTHLWHGSHSGLVCCGLCWIVAQRAAYCPRRVCGMLYVCVTSVPYSWKVHALPMDQSRCMIYIAYIQWFIDLANDYILTQSRER